MMVIMTLVLEESKEISLELLEPLLASVKTSNKEVLPIARRLAEKVFEGCADKLKPYLVEAVNSSGVPLGEYGKVVASICGGTTRAVEHNDRNAFSEQLSDERKLIEESLDEAAQEPSDEPHLGFSSEMPKKKKPKTSSGKKEYPTIQSQSATILVALKSNYGVHIGADSRSTVIDPFGNYEIASNKVKKISKITPYIVVAYTGEVSIGSALISYLENLRLGQFPVRSLADLVVNTLKGINTRLADAYHMEAVQRMCLVIAGYDVRDGLQIYEASYYGVIERPRLSVVGSGSVYLSKYWRDCMAVINGSDYLTIQRARDMVHGALLTACCWTKSCGGDLVVYSILPSGF